MEDQIDRIIKYLNDENGWDLSVEWFDYVEVKFCSITSSTVDLKGYFDDSDYLYFDRNALYDKPRHCPVRVADASR